MSKRRIGPRIKPTSKRTIEDFERAVIARYAVGQPGSGMQDLLSEYDEKLFDARFSLYELIQQLEATAAIKIEVQQ
jgi:hypothetical protein